MPLLPKIRIEEQPSCFIIDSDEETGSEGTQSVENNGTNYTFNDMCEDLLVGVHNPLSTKEVATEKATNKLDDDNNLSLGVNGSRCIQEEEEAGFDDFEFEFQSIDEAEQTEHILKVRVHANFCMRCGTGFVQKKKLNMHLEKNECTANTCGSETPLTCSICGRGFFRRNCLRHHFMLHAQTKPFKCKKCSRSFTTQRDLYKHYRKHKDYRPFICELCPKAYQLPKHLAAHRRRDHARERPYVCRVCPKRFNKPRNLIAHKKKHASKKPFKCKFCKLRYAQNSIRNIHMRTHTNSGELRFLCEICGLTHIRWIKLIPALERRQSDDSIICLEEDEFEKAKEKPRQQGGIIRRMQSSESSDSVEIVEDPLQFTIDLVDE
ncbi:zinc finger protein 133-like [Eupeodes corollae]|uniref:zinc finger protein 133-like n=1 Tax=Eupeodes corollae TaxID=290404 RepID=UPI0024918348|nr:zinc finger protein 133-like [Eupeodes corollae]